MLAPTPIAMPPACPPADAPEHTHTDPEHAPSDSPLLSDTPPLLPALPAEAELIDTAPLALDADDEAPLNTYALPARSPLPLRSTAQPPFFVLNPALIDV